MTINEIKAIFEDLEQNGALAIYGIRTQDEEFEPEGEAMTHLSHIWDNDDDTGDTLDGVCASTADFIEMHDQSRGFGYYMGEHCAIIGGNHYSYGEDDGEIIITDPVVIKIIR